MPYGMLQGMQAKSDGRFNKQKESDRQLGIVAETGRSTKMMQGHFEDKLHQKKEDKRLRLDTSNRGLNLHKFTDLKYKNGALNVTKEGLKKYMDDGPERKQLSHHSKPIQKNRLSYLEIKAKQDVNSEFGTGKKYKKSRGSNAKLNKKYKK